ncbi:MAG: quinol:cytochrome C oxidoreductase, partial [Flavobacteriales bacterium 32-35-8]
MILGAIGIGVGFWQAPKTIEDVEKILADSHHGHEAAHVEKVAHDTEAHTVAEPAHSEVAVVDSTKAIVTDSVHATHEAVDSTAVVVAPVADNHDAHKKETVAHEADHDKEHAEHVFHQLQNKPWAALYVACIFFMLISVGVLAFYAIQYAAQAGWSPILFRVMEGITAYLLPGSIIFFILLVAAGMHWGHNHLFVWMDADIINPESVKFDKLIFLKKGWLSVGRFLATAAIILVVWNWVRFKFRQNSIAQDTATDNAPYKKNFKLAAFF